MPKSLEDVKTALTALDAGDELYTAVLSAIDAEKQRGITEKHNANREAQGLRQNLTSLKAIMAELGYTDGADITSWAAETKVALENGKNGKAKDGELVELKTQLARMQGSLQTVQAALETEKTEKAELRTKAQRNLMRSKLTEALKDKVYGSDFLTTSLIAEGLVAVDEDGETVVFKNGDVAVPFDDGVTRLLTERKDIVKNSQRPGGGTDSRPGGGGGKAGTITRAAFDNLTPADRMAHVKDGGKVTD